MSSLWDIINIPMSWVIRFCNDLVNNNYMFTLLIFALIVEILLLPFGIKQQKNSNKQAKLRPKEMAIRKKYAGRDDNVTKQKMQQEIQELYQKEGFNPMGGCLPTLIQFPIIIALYNIVMHPLKYITQLSDSAIDQLARLASGVTGETYQASQSIRFLSQIKSMGYESVRNVEGMTEEVFNNLPNLEIFGGAIDLGAFPRLTEFNWLLLVPVLTFLSYFFSMKMTRRMTYQPEAVDKATGCSNQMMDWMMPLFSVFIAFNVPAAIGVYWIFKSLLGVVKQVSLRYAMPAPKFTEEDFKAAEKEYNVKAEKAPKNKSGRVVRSLHHIDDEDFEDTAEAGRRRREALEAQAAEDAAKKAASSRKGVLGTASVKKDDRDEQNKEKQAKKTEKQTDTAKATETKDTADTAAEANTDNNNNTDGE
ncbi:MAG: membrane protein insertase YidC [Clostridia bacterium]|nr:membrane protein insertase YidC [Clostridia bacterium]